MFQMKLVIVKYRYNNKIFWFKIEAGLGGFFILDLNLKTYKLLNITLLQVWPKPDNQCQA